MIDGRMTSQFAIAQQMTENLVGRNSTGNELVSQEIFETFIQNLVASVGGGQPVGQITFRGEWISTGIYNNNDVVTFNGGAYLMIGTSAYSNTNSPDVDPTSWLALSGTMLLTSDMNTVRTNLMFFTSQGAINAPASAPYGYGFVLANGTGYILQVYFANQGNQIYIRQFSSPTWYPWYLVAETFPTVGVLSVGVGGTVFINPASGTDFQFTVDQDITFSIAGFPTSTFGQYMCRGRIEFINPGAHTITWGNVFNWIKPDGTITQNFSDLGITLNVTGSNFFEYWSRDGGTTIYMRPITG